MARIRGSCKHISWKEIVVFIFLLLFLLVSAGCNPPTANNSEKAVSKVDGSSFEGYTRIDVHGGDLSGQRLPNVVVDIGFGDREYYAFTNDYGQLIKVTAAEIILQDDDNEPVLESGRYYPDEAKVPGTESLNP